MNDESIEKAEEIEWGIIKWLVGLAATFGILGTIFWAVFYSVDLANNHFAMKARSWYQGQYWNLEEKFFPKQNRYPPFPPIYTFQVQPWGDDYAYTLIGKYLRTDNDRGIIHIKGYDGNIYAFLVSPEFVKETIGIFEFVEVKYSPVQDNINIGAQPFTGHSIIEIVWDDKRRLKELMNDYSNNPGKPLNSDSTLIFSFTKFN